MSPTLKSTGGWVTLGPNLGVFPLEQTRHVGVAKSEHARLTNGEIIFEEFQPMWSQSTNVTDRRIVSQHTSLAWQNAADRVQLAVGGQIGWSHAGQWQVDQGGHLEIHPTSNQKPVQLL